MRRIVVLTAGFGEGHNSAARNVCTALNLEPGVTAEVHDPLVAFGKTYEDSKRRYLETVTRSPGLWRIGYHLLDRLPLAPLAVPWLKRAELRLEEILRETQADTAVCTYPLYPWLLRRIARRGGPSVKIATIVTDSITINRVWAGAPSDIWLTADRYSARKLAQLGISMKRIHTTGFPVSPEFSRPDESGPRSDPAISGETRVLFIAATAARGTVTTARELAALPGVALTVTVGRNEALGEEVAKALAESGHRADIVGWTNRMPALLRAHHIVLGKAGGATTHETLAARTPFIMTQVLPGQEEGNAILIRRLGAGEVATTPGSAALAVRRLIENNAYRWKECVGKILRRTTTEGASRATRVILGL